MTDGSRFTLSDAAWMDANPVLQSWVAYSLARSVCQLEVGGANPARNTSFECEHSSREILVERWAELGGRPVMMPDAPPQLPGARYLDELTSVANAGYLAEYTWQFHKRGQWQRPAGLRLPEFSAWKAKHLTPRHRPRTRIMGSWSYPPPPSEDEEPRDF